jgi:thiol-disulfide isomerase/thioredoxin
MPSTRRQLVRRAVSLAAVGGLAGCTARLPSSGGGESNDPADDGASAEPLSLPAVATPGRDGTAEQVRVLPEGTVTLVNFFTTWCKPCREEMPAFRKLRAAYDRDTVHMVSITPEVDEALITEFWNRYDATWPVVKDPALRATERWDADAYPTNLLFDRDGDPASGSSPEVNVRSFDGFRSQIDPLLEGE